MERIIQIGRRCAPVLKEFTLLAVVGFVVFVALGVFDIGTDLLRRRDTADALITCVILLPIGVMAVRRWWNRYGREPK